MKKSLLWRIAVWGVLALIFFVGCGVAFGWTKSDWAAWVQAVGSVVAILAAAGFVQWQHRLELERRISDDRLARRRRLAVIVELAKTNVYNLGFVIMQFGTRESFTEIAELQTEFDLSYVDDLGDTTAAIPLHDLDDAEVASRVLLSTMHARQARGTAQRMLRQHRNMNAATYESSIAALKRELDGCKSCLSVLVECAKLLADPA